MKDWSRRQVFRATAGAAIAVPMAALGGGLAAAGEPSGTVADSGPQWSAGAGAADLGPVMFCIHDAQLGEVSILHGTNEVIVRDRTLVARILQAAGSQPTTVSQKA